MSDTIIELTEDPPPFNQDEWIGKGKKYTTQNIDLGLAYHCDNLLTIPPEIYKTHFPSPGCTVRNVLQFTLPAGTYSLAVIKAESCFSDKAPNEDGSQLASRPLPSKAWVESIHNHFRQAVLDGKKSIEDPQFRGSYLPLWSIRFWMEMWRVHEVRSTWKSALEWVTAKKEKLKGEALQWFVEGISLLEDLRWDERSMIPGADGRNTSTIDFAAFLSSNTMMSTDHINMMFAHLSDRAEMDPKFDDVVGIETLRFMHEMEKAKNRKHWDAPQASFLSRLEERVVTSEIEAIVFPVYMAKERHWVTFRIDFEAREIAYGDSLVHKGMPRPRDAIQKLKWWLETRFKRTFDDAGDALFHGKQMDTTDCGILAANTAAHEIFDDEIWKVGNKAVERVKWFVRLARAHMLDVNAANGDDAPYQFEIRPVQDRASIPHLLNPQTDPRTSINNILNDDDDGFQIMGAREPMPMDVESTYNKASPDVLMGEPGIKVGNDTDIGPPASGPASENTGIESNRLDEDIEGDIQDKVNRGKKRRASESTGASASRKVGKISTTAPDDTPERKKGTSRSAIYARVLNQQYKAGTFVVNERQFERFKQKILAIDKHSLVIDAKSVRHTKCARVYQMKSPYSPIYFEDHCKPGGCKGPTRERTGAGNSLPIDYLFMKQTASNSALSGDGQSNRMPCPGLLASRHVSIDGYLDRTGAKGGGASSVNSIAIDLYQKPYKKLSDIRKRHVKTAQLHEHKWRNDHDGGAVFSTDCTKYARAEQQLKLKGEKKGDIDELLPCGKCSDLWRLKGFQNALRVPKPADENYKYLNKEYRNDQLGSLIARVNGLGEILKDKSKKPLVGFMAGVISGKYQENEVFGGILQVVALKHDKLRRGVGNQNFKYPPGLVEFAHIVHTHSPAAYKDLSEFIPLPDPRTLQLQRAKLPQFPMGICERSFDLVVARLHDLQYDGPVALSCDDTKLLASYRPYYDNEKKGFYLMGHIGNPIALPNPDAFRDIIHSHELRKATKIRLFCIQIPIQKIPPILVGALCIPENMTAHDLLVYLRQVLTGLISRDVKVSSYASDGSTVERNLQRLLQAEATSTNVIPITHGRDGAPEYLIKIPIFGNKQPIAILQDPKHLLKTMRNNLTSGARCLTFPSGVANYVQIEEMALAKDSPLYHRDIIKADRQDDNAAVRLFSAAALKWLVTNHADQLGPIIYLFIFGELVDAYENRFILLVERVQLVFRAQFFIEMWEKFLEVSGYPKGKHFVSSQCVDIVRTLIQGFLQALVIYRDSSDGSRPFLPWLLSTEVVEHVFGICRTIVKDFTALDFHNMVPKLFIMLRKAAFSAKFSSGRERASGYNHTYNDVRGIDIVALSTYPSNSEMNDAARKAYSEAASLFALMGVPPDTLYRDTTQISAPFPSIGSWYHGLDDPVGEDTSDDELDNESTLSIDDYQELLDQLEDLPVDLRYTEEKKIQSFRNATIALSIQDRLQIADLPDLEGDELEEANSDDANQITEVLECAKESRLTASNLPAVQDNVPQNPFDISDTTNIELTPLIDLRLCHQTKQAHTGVRTTQAPALATPAPALSDRQKLIREFQNVVREMQDRGVGTGMERNARWKDSQKGGSLSDGTSGNAANAAAVAGAVAKRALDRRKKIMQTSNLLKEFSDAQVNSDRPLYIANSSGPEGRAAGSCYGICVSPTLNRLMIGKVLALFSKSGGKGAKHNSVATATNIMALSYITVQVYDYHLGPRFRSVPQTQALWVPRYDHVPPSAFLFALTSNPTVVEGGIKVSDRDQDIFQRAQQLFPKILGALKSLNKKSKKEDADNDGDE